MSKRIGKYFAVKQYVVTAEDSVYVGLDVHKASVHAAMRLNGREVRGQESAEGRPFMQAEGLPRFQPGAKPQVEEMGKE